MQAVPRSTLASGTFFCRNGFPLPLIQEEQVVSYWLKSDTGMLPPEGSNGNSVVK